MGAAQVRRLVAEGAAVVIGDVLTTEGAALAEELTGADPAARRRVLPVHLDVASADSWAGASCRVRSTRRPRPTSVASTT